MKYTILIDQVKSLEWELSLSEAAMFAFVYNLSSWAEPIYVNGQTWYFGSRNKAVEEVPIVTDKPDTVYRLYKSLQAKGLIEWQKFGEKDCIRLTDIGRQWNTVSETTDGKKSEPTRKKIRVKTEKNPTYNRTKDNRTNDNSSFSNEKGFPENSTENIGDVAAEFEAFGEPSPVKAEKKKTPPKLREAPPAAKEPTETYLMYEAWAQFVESKGIAVSKSKTGNSYVFAPKDGAAIKKWREWCAGLPNASGSLDDWHVFLQAAWEHGGKWYQSNFTPCILNSKRQELMAAFAQYKAKNEPDMSMVGMSIDEILQKY
jgi:DNA-binding PadR family transcriptional regulator